MSRTTKEILQDSQNRAATDLELWDEKDVHKATKLSLSKIRRMRFAHEGPRVTRINKNIRYRRSDVEKWLQDCTEAR